MKFERRDVVLYFAGLLTRNQESAIESAAGSDPRLSQWFKELKPEVSYDHEGIEESAIQVFDRITSERQGRPATASDPEILLCQQSDRFFQLLTHTAPSDASFSLVDIESHQSFSGEAGFCGSPSLDFKMRIPVLVDTDRISFDLLTNPEADFVPGRYNFRFENELPDSSLNPAKPDVREPVESIGLIDTLRDQTANEPRATFDVSIAPGSGDLLVNVDAGGREALWIVAGLPDHHLPVRLEREMPDSGRLSGRAKLPVSLLPPQLDWLSITIRPVWLSQLSHLQAGQISDWVNTVKIDSIPADRSGVEFSCSASQSRIQNVASLASSVNCFVICRGARL